MTTYGQSVSAVPFRQCDNKNIGISSLCKLEAKGGPNPPAYGAKVHTIRKKPILIRVCTRFVSIFFYTHTGLSRIW